MNRIENPGHPVVHPINSPPDDRVEIDACPVCSCCFAHPKFAIEGVHFQVVVCNDCGSGRLDPQPTDEEIQEFYRGEYYGTAGAKFHSLIELLVRWIGRRHINFLLKHLESDARILDLGCGRGVLLRAFLDRGYETHGVEISKEATEGADPRAEIRVATHLADAEYPADFFDKVIVWHVFEHLPDPRETLLEIRRILKPGGSLVIAVPNFSSMQSRWAGAAWFHLDLPRHLFHFPLDALCRLLSECGFESQSQHHFSLRQNPFGWLQSFLNRNPNLPRNGLYTLLHRRAKSEPAPFHLMTRLRLRFWFWMGIPISLAMGIIEAVIRSGSTVHIVTQRPTNSEEDAD